MRFKVWYVGPTLNQPGHSAGPSLCCEHPHSVQSQKAVTAYFTSKQLLPFGIAEQSLSLLPRYRPGQEIPQFLLRLIRGTCTTWLDIGLHDKYSMTARYFLNESSPTKQFARLWLKVDPKSLTAAQYWIKPWGDGDTHLGWLQVFVRLPC